MNTRMGIGIFAAILIIGAAAWYFSSDERAGVPEPEETAAGTSTFAELIGRAGSWRCDVEASIEEVPSQGTAYIADGKIRADFATQVAALGGQEVASSMIWADGYVYTWSDTSPQGMKMPLAQAGSVESAGAVSSDERIEYSCAPWTADQSLFMPPAGIVFMEFDASVFQGLPEGVPLPR